MTVDPCAIDAELEDAGAVGPELAFIAKEQRLLPRALCWRDASSDWPLLIVQIPGTEALWMLQHPVFTPIIRRWGMALRVIGISREAMAYDFRALLSDSTLAKLRSALRDDPQQAPVDLIYQALAQGMLTRLHPSGQMAKHLLREGYIHPNSEAIEPADSAHRPLLIKALQTALRRGQLDIGFYSRAMRAIRRRESLVQQRLAFIFEGALSPLSLQLCARLDPRIPWGVYNWLHRDPRHAAAREHLLRHLPWLGPWLANHLLLDVDSRLQQVIDSGQDSLVLENLAAVFAVDPNLLRRLWRRPIAMPAELNDWQLPRMLAWLQQKPERLWPADESSWDRLFEALALLSPPSIA
ncbi:MAG: hypothetical protein EBW71_09280 [Betaproteobacteria bacterium]|nr:hypothetical protein [Betaproteobacteria bacterium]NCW99157.1 hypothetical protein [Betaproteobacteria bacterium]